jgi:hypothetical protein
MDENIIILHDFSRGCDVSRSTLKKFLENHAETLAQNRGLRRKLERAISLGREIRFELGSAGLFSLRRAPKLAFTAQTFRAALARIGTVAGMTIEEVYALWAEYSYRNSGQSCLICEFVEWYESRLGGDRSALRVAAGGTRVPASQMS